MSQPITFLPHLCYPLLLETLGAVNIYRNMTGFFKQLQIDISCDFIYMIKERAQYIGFSPTQLTHRKTPTHQMVLSSIWDLCIQLWYIFRLRENGENPFYIKTNGYRLSIYSYSNPFFTEHAWTGKQRPLLNAIMKCFLKCIYLLEESIAWKSHNWSFLFSS